MCNKLKEKQAEGILGRGKGPMCPLKSYNAPQNTIPPKISPVAVFLMLVMMVVIKLSYNNQNMCPGESERLSILTK